MDIGVCSEWLYKLKLLQFMREVKEAQRDFLRSYGKPMAGSTRFRVQLYPKCASFTPLLIQFNFSLVKEHSRLKGTDFTEKSQKEKKNLISCTI